MSPSPRRTCVVCRAAVEVRGEAADRLVRFVLSPISSESGERELLLDAEGKSPGRGAYSHLRPECLRSPKLAGALVSSLTRRSKGPKVHVGRMLDQLRSFGQQTESASTSSSKEASKEKTKSGKHQSKKIRL